MDIGKIVYLDNNHNLYEYSNYDYDSTLVNTTSTLLVEGVVDIIQNNNTEILYLDNNNEMNIYLLDSNSNIFIANNVAKILDYSFPTIMYIDSLNTFHIFDYYDEEEIYYKENVAEFKEIDGCMFYKNTNGKLYIDVDMDRTDFEVPDDAARANIRFW